MARPRTRERPRRLPGGIKAGIREAGERRAEVERLRREGYIVRETPEGITYQRPEEPRDWRLERREVFARRVSPEERARVIEASALGRAPKKKVVLRKTKEGIEVVSTEGLYTPQEREKFLKKVETGVDLERAFREQKFAKYPAPTRAIASFGRAAVTTGIRVLTFPEVVLEEVGGRLETGIRGEPIRAKQYIPKDFLLSRERAEEWIAKTDIGAPSGFITVGIEKAIGGKEEERRAKKFPIEAVFATGGELAAFWGVSKATHVGKVAIRRGLTKAGLPSVARYKPTFLVRKKVLQLKTKVGKAKYVPEEQVWDPKVLARKKRFAEAPGPKAIVKEFEKRRGVIAKGELTGIHATPFRFGKRLRRTAEVRPGTSETAGLSISVYGRGSPHFLKIADTAPSYAARTTILPKLTRPTAPLFQFKDIYRLPKGLRKAPYKKVSEYLVKQPKGRYVTVAAKAERGGPEIEAIIAAGTKPVKVSTKIRWTTFKGVPVELPQYKLVGAGKPSLARIGLVSRAKERITPSIYTSKPTTPIARPSYVASIGSSLKSRPSVTRPSKPSYPLSRVSLYPSRPSRPSLPSRPSEPSYITPLIAPTRKKPIGAILAPEEKKKKRRIFEDKYELTRGARERVHPIKLLEI